MTEKKIDAAGASDYFKTRTTRATQWARYDKSQQGASVVEATDLFLTTFQAEPNHEVPAECWCIYEQALYLLARNATPKGTGNEEPALNGPETDGELLSAAESNFGAWSTLALSKLGQIRVRNRNSVG